MRKEEKSGAREEWQTKVDWGAGGSGRETMGGGGVYWERERER